MKLDNMLKNPFVKFLTDNWVGGVVGLIGLPFVTVLAMGPLESMMMSFTVGGMQLSALGYLGGAAIQKFFFSK